MFWSKAGLIAIHALAHRTEEFTRTVLLHALRQFPMRVFGLTRFREGRRAFTQEFAAAMLAAKIECLPVALLTASGCFIDCHAAYRVNRHDASNLFSLSIDNTDSNVLESV